MVNIRPTSGPAMTRNCKLMACGPCASLESRRGADHQYDGRNQTVQLVRVMRLGAALPIELARFVPDSLKSRPVKVRSGKIGVFGVRRCIGGCSCVFDKPSCSAP